MCEGEREMFSKEKNKECLILEMRIGLEHSKQVCGHTQTEESVVWVQITGEVLRAEASEVYLNGIWSLDSEVERGC